MKVFRTLAAANKYANRCEPRAVRIDYDEKHQMFFVRYVERRKGQRYCAAQFDRDFADRQDVIAWVQRQPHLTLIGED